MKKQQEGRMCCVPSRMITEGLSEEWSDAEIMRQVL
jgi:hypothetical protein